MNENWTSKNPPPELSDEDAELLSAYIDNMLDATEVAALESRLANDAFLRSELAAMKQMLGWLKTMPQLKAPRNFTISEADVKPAVPKLVVLPRRNNWQVLSAAAAIFVVTLGLAVFLSNQQSAKGGNNQVAAAPSEAALDEAEGAPLPETATTLLMATASVPPIASGGSGDTSGSTGSGGGAEPAEEQAESVAGQSTELERSMDNGSGADTDVNPAGSSMETVIIEATGTMVAADGIADIAMAQNTDTANAPTIFAFSTATAQPSTMPQALATSLATGTAEAASASVQQVDAESTEEASVMAATGAEAPESDDYSSANLAIAVSAPSPAQYIRDVTWNFLQNVLNDIRR